MEEKNDLFRKKSLESIASPEQMNDYIKVIGPGIWIVLAGIIVFLTGIIIWGIFGRLETGVDSVAFVREGLAVCYVENDTADDMEEGDEINIGGESTSVISISGAPVQASAVYDAETLSDLKMTGYEMLYAVTANSGLPDGSYKSRIVVERIHPMSFITGVQEQDET